MVVLWFVYPRVAHDATSLFVRHTVVLGCHVQILLYAVAMVVAVAEVVLSIGVAEISSDFEEIDSGFLVFAALTG